MTSLRFQLILTLIVLTVITINYGAPTSSSLATKSFSSSDELVDKSNVHGNDLNDSLKMELVVAAPRSLAVIKPQVEVQKLIKLMTSEGRCSVPRRRVKYISRDLNNGVKKYHPPAVLLNVCDNESGCCLNESETCQPKAREKVNFYFFTTEVVNGRAKSSIEKLSFYNDTACECQRINMGIFR